MFKTAASVTVPRGQHGRTIRTLLFLAAAVIFSALLTHHNSRRPPSVVTHLVHRQEEQQCWLVRSASDQCKFVKEHCPEEEAGLFSYLQLYYCTLHHAHGVAFIIIVLWLCLLFSTIGIAASDFFSINLSTIAVLLGLSENLAGVTFLAFGNGSPDVFSTFAAMSTHSGSLAVGELIGAAGFITAVVSGSMALVRPFEVARASFVRDIVFFICAAILSMVFLLDGQLLMWECVLMIAFYLIYVVIVVAWHWVSGRRTARRVQEATARQHFSTSQVDLDADVGTERTLGVRRSDSGDASQLNHDEQFRLLETAGLEGNEQDLGDETQRQAASEINQNMRVNRSRVGLRRATRNTIRPSLVGALEFRAVLSSLEKSRSQQAPPINLRRYSDDPGLRPFQQGRLFTPRPSDAGIDRGAGESQEQTHLTPYIADSSAARGRNRAASANDVASLQTSSTQNDGERVMGSYGINSQDDGQPAARAGLESLGTVQTHLLQPPDTAHSPPANATSRKPTKLDTFGAASSGSPEYLEAESSQNANDPMPGITRRVSSGLISPGTGASSPLLAFPQYHDDPNLAERPSRTSSIRLPPPRLDFAASVDSLADSPPKRVAWWPYKYLPGPQDLLSTLFPTVYSWPQRNAWERLIGIFAAPSVFVLTITLPVVEEKAVDGSSDYEAVPTVDVEDAPHLHSPSDPPLISIEGPSEADSLQSTFDHSRNGQEVAGAINNPIAKPRSASDPQEPSPSSTGWNRWLICTQIIMAPLFVTMILWANLDEDLSLRGLVLLEAYAMIGALLVLAFTLYTTSADRAPRYRSMLSFVGFVVSVAWISTIANEVVGVLKALGVIFGISDAILGLTIFAVGNSLGDLVADITVAKLGYPVMALGACIGGPMLNILLGIGIGGLYMTIRDSETHGGDTVFAPYHVQVGGTLLVSAVALLITLAGLLIAVPLNGWVMDRKIGTGLITLWCISTIVNVALEVSGAVSSSSDDTAA